MKNMNVYEEYTTPSIWNVENSAALESMQETFELMKQTYDLPNAGIAFHKALQEMKNKLFKSQQIQDQSSNFPIQKLISIKDQTLVIQIFDDLVIDMLMQNINFRNPNNELLQITLDRILTRSSINKVKIIANILDTFVFPIDIYVLFHIVEPITGFFRNNEINDITIRYVGYNGLLALFLTEIVTSIEVSPFAVFLLDSAEYNDVLKFYDDTKAIADYYFNVLKEKGILTQEEIDKLTKSNELITFTADRIQEAMQQPKQPETIGGNE